MRLGVAHRKNISAKAMRRQRALALGLHRVAVRQKIVPRRAAEGDPLSSSFGVLAFWRFGG